MENTLLILIRSPDRNKLSTVTAVTVPFVLELPSVLLSPHRIFPFLDTKISAQVSFSIYRNVKTKLL